MDQCTIALTSLFTPKRTFRDGNEWESKQTTKNAGEFGESSCTDLPIAERGRAEK